jgi:CBS domain containing-hemolysin-like protein
MEDIASIFIILGVIFLNGTFVAAEFSIARLRKSQIDFLAKSPNTDKATKRTAKLLKRMLENINDYISACQVGITIASLMLGALAEAKLEEMLSPFITSLHLPFGSHTLAIVLAIGIVTFFHVILGELIPKNLAILNPEKTGLRLAWFLQATYTFFKLPVLLLNMSSNAILKLIGIDINVAHSSIHSEDELKMILSTSQEEGVIEEEEEKLMQNIFDFNDTVARDIMRPRTEMICIEAGVNIEEAAKFTNNYSYAKFPIFENRLDNIVGYVHIKEILKCFEAGCTHEPIENICKEVLKVPDGMYVIDLMELMQQKKKQIAILIDEYGGTSGLVTAEDIVEEIFGEITDETEDAPNAPIVSLGNGDYLVEGTVGLKEINSEVGSNFNSDHYDTVGGYVYGLLGSEPSEGDQVEEDGFILKIESFSENRVRMVRISSKVKASLADE